MPVITSCWALFPKLKVAFVIVPSESLPVAVKLIANGAAPDETDELRERQSGD